MHARGMLAWLTIRCSRFLMPAQALQVAQVDIPDTQVTALLRMIERDGKALHVAQFLDRFQVVYSSAAEQGLSAAESATGKRVRELLNRVGRRLLQYHGNSRMKLFEQARAFPSAVDVFVLVHPTIRQSFERRHLHSRFSRFPTTKRNSSKSLYFCISAGRYKRRRLRPGGRVLRHAFLAPTQTSAF